MPSIYSVGGRYDDKIYNSAKEFSLALTKMTAQLEKNVDQVIRKTALDLYRRIVKRTPHDTGRARANWHITLDGKKEKEESGNTAWQENMEENSIYFGAEVAWNKKIVIYNNLSYISVLEEGRGFRDGQMRGSIQAPYGMVAISLDDFTEHFNKELSKYEGFKPL